MSNQGRERELIEQRARKIYDNAEEVLAKGLPNNDVRQMAEWAAFTARAMSALSGLMLYSGHYEDSLRALQIAEMAESVLVEGRLLPDAMRGRTHREAGEAWAAEKRGTITPQTRDVLVLQLRI